MFIFWLWTFNCLLGCVSHFYQRNSSVCSNSIREASEQFVKICEICIVIVFTGNFEQISYSPRISLMLNCTGKHILEVFLRTCSTFVISIIDILNISTAPLLTYWVHNQRLFSWISADIELLKVLGRRFQYSFD